jgi:predicted PurR-regulated permease PerM
VIFFCFYFYSSLSHYFYLILFLEFNNQHKLILSTNFKFLVGNLIASIVIFLICVAIIVIVVKTGGGKGGMSSSKLSGRSGNFSSMLNNLSRNSNNWNKQWGNNWGNFGHSPNYTRQMSPQIQQFARQMSPQFQQFSQSPQMSQSFPQSDTTYDPSPEMEYDNYYQE